MLRAIGVEDFYFTSDPYGKLNRVHTVAGADVFQQISRRFQIACGTVEVVVEHLEHGWCACLGHPLLPCINGTSDGLWLALVDYQAGSAGRLGPLSPWERVRVRQRQTVLYRPIIWQLWRAHRLDHHFHQRCLSFLSGTDSAPVGRK